MYFKSTCFIKLFQRVIKSLFIRLAIFLYSVLLFNRPDKIIFMNEHPALSAKKFFKRNGKALKSVVNDKFTFTINSKSRSRETVGSLFDDSLTTLALNTPTNTIRLYISTTFEKIKSKFFAVASKDRSKYSMAAGIILAFGLIYSSSIIMPQVITPTVNDKYFIYSSKPLVLAETSDAVLTKDARAQKLDAVFKMYDCPLEGLGQTFVDEADKNNIPWWLVAAVSFKESSCGKYTPTVNGKETYNAWGWGVYGTSISGFDNWVRGIETVSQYFSQKFYQNGITNVCDIMKIYTPPSNGSWCTDVNNFGNIMQSYESPQISQS